MSDSLPSPSDSTPPKKRAAKKAAAKKVATSAEAPAPAAKKAAKKAASKVAKKVAAVAPAEAPVPAAPKKRAAKKAAAVTAPEPAQEKVKVARPKKAAAETAPPAVASVVVSAPAPVAIPAPAPVPVAAPAPAPAPQQHQPRPPQHQQPHQQQRQHPNDFKKNKFGKNKKNGFERHPKQKNKNFGNAQGPQKFDPDAERNQAVLEGPKTEVEGLLELTPKGSGFLRSLKKSFEMAKDDAFVGTALINKWGLRSGAVIKALTQMGPRGPQVVEVLAVNDSPPEEARRLPHFEELTAVNPSKRIPFENDQNRFTTRVLDIIAPVGRGQRGLIVSPPRSGKTTLMLHIAESVRQREDDSLHLIILLVDERPEEVTEFRRALPGVEIFASSNDEHPRNHCRIAELTIERAKRLVEAGKHVFLLMDSITRLARAYNNTGSTQGRGIGTGGVTVGALEAPRRLFAAARNTRGAGSLTILATALIQTNSRADEAIFQEFKGTGNMEIVLDRKIAENYIYPAVDIFKSGTRREELLLPEHMLHKIHLIRRGLSGHKPLEAMERLTYFLKKFPSNAQMLLEIKG
jgi:transcription termination factor Rho